MTKQQFGNSEQLVKAISESTKPLALIYSRVSTTRQVETGYSLDSQSEALVNKAKAEGYQVEVIKESGSGRKVNRPKLNQAVAKLNLGQAQALFALDLDRLTRSSGHAIEIIEMAEKNNWRLVILSLNMDTGTVAGRIKFSQLAMFAEFESDMISQRAKRQHQARRDRGEVWGVTSGTKSKLPQETRALILELRANGLSLRRICDQLTARGLVTVSGGDWYASTVKHYLESPPSRDKAK
jgi:DNA invertase Pin-like site-specific DNA recombinase